MFEQEQLPQLGNSLPGLSPVLRTFKYKFIRKFAFFCLYFSWKHIIIKKNRKKVKLPLEQSFLTGDHWALSGDTLVVTLWVNATGFQRVEARAATSCPRMRTIAPQ